jgi:hypothetical protein
MVQAYCVKCKIKGQEMKDPVIHQTPKGTIWLRFLPEMWNNNVCNDVKGQCRQGSKSRR